jgi:hypothetical protein
VVSANREKIGLENSLALTLPSLLTAKPTPSPLPARPFGDIPKPLQALAATCPNLQSGVECGQVVWGTTPLTNLYRSRNSTLTVFLFTGRLLKEKVIGPYTQAAITIWPGINNLCR